MLTGASDFYWPTTQTSPGFKRSEGEVAIGRLLSGVVSVSTFVASPGGLVRDYTALSVTFGEAGMVAIAS